MSKYVIENGVPPPNSELVNSRIYPFLDMQVGDSVLINDKSIHTLSGSVKHAQHKLKNSKFICRTVTDGVRVWRIK